MIRVFLTSLGEVLSTISGDINNLDLNTLEGDLYIDLDEIPSDIHQHYYDYESSAFLAVGEAPSQNHIFNYELKGWIDPRTLNQVKDQKWEQIKSERDAFEFGGFEFDGCVYDSDQVSQGRILGAVLAGLPQIWTLANNATVSLSAEQLKSLYTALQMHVAAAHDRGRIARESIQAATIKEQVEAIVF